MSSLQMYDTGLDLLKDWTTATYKFMLLKSSSFTIANQFVSDLTPGTNEITESGYSRQTVTTPVRNVNSGLHRIEYQCDDPSFGSPITTGENVIAIVLYKFITNDAASPLVGWADLTSTDTASFDPFTVVIGGGYVAYLEDV